MDLLGVAGNRIRQVMDVQKLTCEQREKVLCALLAQNTIAHHRQDQWAPAAVQTMERLRVYLSAACVRQQALLANAEPGGSA